MLKCHRENRLIEIVLDGVEEGFLGMGFYCLSSVPIRVINRILGQPTGV